MKYHDSHLTTVTQVQLASSICQNLTADPVTLYISLRDVTAKWQRLRFQRSGNGIGRINEVTLWSPVSTGMGDRPSAGKPIQYVTSHPGQLSLLTSVG